ncbi:Clavaminate synthase-like protein [Nemania abortiva]|nr:Clavaminate synthase-like protein [Nemania abortiva]
MNTAIHMLSTISRSHADHRGRTSHDEPELSALLYQQDAASAKPPLGFPSFVEGPMAWSGKNGVPFTSRVLEFTPTDVMEVNRAIDHFLGLGLDGSEVTCENFLLPDLGPRLKDCAADIHAGSGLCIIRGLTPTAYSAEVNAIIFLGLASYVGGERGVQTSKGAMLTHVYESSTWTVPRERRHGIHTNSSLPFHNDMGCEILAMHIRSCAAQGGGTYVASAATVYNAMMKANPWAVHTLAKHNWPVQVSRRGASPFILAPLLGFQSGNLIISVDPNRIGPRPGVADGRIPALLPAQKEALELLQRTATAQQVLLPTRRGDMVFINNWSVLHARDSYQDDDTASRHIVRLWLRNSELGWVIPESMKTPWEASFGLKAKKIINRQYAVEPMPEYMEPKFTNGSAAFIIEESDEDEKDIEERRHLSQLHPARFPSWQR